MTRIIKWYQIYYEDNKVKTFLSVRYTDLMDATKVLEEVKRTRLELGKRYNFVDSGCYGIQTFESVLYER